MKSAVRQRPASGKLVGPLSVAAGGPTAFCTSAIWRSTVGSPTSGNIAVLQQPDIVRTSGFLEVRSYRQAIQILYQWLWLAHPILLHCRLLIFRFSYFMLRMKRRVMFQSIRRLVNYSTTKIQSTIITACTILYSLLSITEINNDIMIENFYQINRNIVTKH